jgi:hypothetical protein
MPLVRQQVNNTVHIAQPIAANGNLKSNNRDQAAWNLFDQIETQSHPVTTTAGGR